MAKKYPNGVKVFIDYAHTPDALLKTLSALKSYYRNNITAVFGCGGERDKKKRSQMAKIANQICRKIYITDDNPRNEDPKRIRNYLSKYIDKNKLFNIGNRSLAIKKAIKSADPQEIILIAGKGHEEEQIYKNKVIKISDKKILKKINLRNKTLNKLETLFFQNNNVINKILGKTKLKFNGISIDTRTIKKNNLFLGIKGKNLMEIILFLML